MLRVLIGFFLASSFLAAPALAQSLEPAVAPEMLPSDPEAATRMYLDSVPDEKRQSSDAYFEGGHWLGLWGFLYGIGVAWLVLARGWSARMRDWGEKVTRFRPVHTAAYVVQYTLLTAVIGFPLAYYRDFWREHQYGLATQAFGGWMRDQLVGLGVSVVLGSLLFVALYGVLRRAERSWPLLGAGVMIAFLTFSMLIGPVYIAPLFNDYEALTDPAVRDPILEVARANGIPVNEVYQFDASRQSTRISANVSGILGTMRISLNDNLLNRCSQAEIESVMAHEMGHYVLNHVYKHLLFFGVVIVIGFGFLRWSFAKVQTCCGERWGIRGIGDVANLPLLSALLSVYFFALAPVINTQIRVAEAEADIFGLNASRQPEGFAEVSLKLGEYRKLDPGPIEEFLLFDHPSGRARILMAMRWRAASNKRPVE